MGAGRLKVLAPRVQVRASTLVVHTPGSWRTDKTNAHQRGYGRRWRAYREQWLRAHPLCGDRLHRSSDEHSACLKAGRAVPARVIDHIIPHRGNQGLFWAPTNHQSLCSHCHDTIKAKADAQLVG